MLRNVSLIHPDVLTRCLALLLAALLLTPAVSFAESDRGEPGPRAEPREFDRPPRDGFGPPPHERKDWKQRGPVTEAQIQERLQLLREIAPEMADRIQELRQSDPERAERMIRRGFPRMGHLLELKEKDPEAFELRKNEMNTGFAVLKLMREAKQQHDSEGQVQPDTLDALRTRMSEHMETKLKVREHEIQRMEQRLTDLRARLEDERQNHDQRVAERIEQIEQGNFRPPREGKHDHEKKRDRGPE